MASPSKAKLPKPVTKRGEATRRKILDAAELEFGEKGFMAASVSSITARAGVGQGTFYLYFPSKETVLSELVRYMGRELRHTLTDAVKGLERRSDIEKTGIEAFLAFAKKHKNLYRIVMESQFVDVAVYQDYYQSLASAYARGLEQAQEKEQVRPGNAEAKAWALMGVTHFLGLRYAIWQDKTPPQEVMDSTLDFIFNGLVTES
ncbi:MAG: TetR/AcrR family transcriptional regulator [Trueperaceae bacterium]|nr:TetR/AcrR family transcriptional regulator [Trueperaceae bacterium]